MKHYARIPLETLNKSRKTLGALACRLLYYSHFTDKPKLCSADPRARPARNILPGCIVTTLRDACSQTPRSLRSYSSLIQAV